MPHVHHGGGVTDGFIDGFHDLFGFPDGGRDAVPSDVIDTGLDQFAAGALQGTLGGSVNLSSSLTLDIGVTEDLTGAGAPDVVFLATLAARL